jgi:hypothetical protein
MQDLSGEARFGPWATSQAGGNMVSSNEQAMTAPGSQPSDPLPDREHQGDPAVQASATLPVGTAPSRLPMAYQPVPVTWKAMD